MTYFETTMFKVLTKSLNMILWHKMLLNDSVVELALDHVIRQMSR